MNAFISPLFCTMRRSTRRTRKSSAVNDESKASIKREPTSDVKTRRSPKRARLANHVAKPEPTFANDIEDLPATSVAPSESNTRQVLSVLREMYGRRTPSTRSQPVLDSLIATILSQATTNANSSRAFKSLKTAYPTWGAARRASSAAIADAIRAGGLADQKAPRILAILDKLGENPSLEHLRDLPNEQVKSALCAFPGVGPKTAACVLMFNMRRAEFPVDTHVRRLCGRIGWTPPNATPEKVYEVMNECLPDDTKYEMHVLLIEHGRKTCKARAPKCGLCALSEHCQYFAELAREEEQLDSSREGSVDVKPDDIRVKSEVKDECGEKTVKVAKDDVLDNLSKEEPRIKEEPREEDSK